jgi:hypothetical protein
MTAFDHIPAQRERLFCNRFRNHWILPQPLFLLILIVPLVAVPQPTDPRSLRPPAVPLVAHDPYFSIWSPADCLTEADTVHWTGKPHRLTSLARIDGQPFRLMGLEPSPVPALPQTRLEVLPTRTIYTFQGRGVQIILTFLTPALPRDLDLCSRPTTYLTWTASATDGKPHDVRLYFDASLEIAVNTPDQDVSWDRPMIPGLKVLRAGSVEQPVLRKKGDDLRIDWGHLFAAAPEASDVQAEFRTALLSRDEFLTDEVGAGRARNDLFGGSVVKGSVLAFTFNLGRVSSPPVSRHLILAYDDEYSIQYFREKLRPYWRRGGGEAIGLLGKAESDYASLAAECARFDDALMAELRRTGGDDYGLLCALAYRQTLAGNKIVADAKGQPLMFPKENFSNGCIGTVDVLFPQAPFFLVFSPALTKAMLKPILDYAASPRWKFDHAPHDLGTYPHATGQVYGGGEQTDENQMPVEESGNMLLMLAALARVEGNADFVKPYWPLVTQWAEYCVKEGLDPANQLCSADMFGHLPRCANLALKAIIAIGGYAQLCEESGRAQEAAKYFAIARDYAVKWLELAGDDGRTRLAYHLPNTWGMKHNLIWDRVLGLNLFPASVGDAEIAWYLKVQNPYGLPVDNRTDTSLLDWALWSIAPARNPKDFAALLKPIFRYVNETPSRVPLSDWFVTTDGRQKGFQARPVVGGLFIRMLADPSGRAKWAGAGANVTGAWAPLPLPPPSREIVPTARERAVKWRFSLEPPGEDWSKPGFDDSAWREGEAAFGTKGTPGAPIRSEWNTREIWLRRWFAVPGRPLKNPRLLLIYDENPEVYLNGLPAAQLTGWTGSYQEMEIHPEALATLRPGTNLLAVRATQTYGGQSIDAGLVEDSPLPGLRKLMDTPLRDTSICRGGDGYWYLTGTVEPFWGYNEGISLWKSRDLRRWESLGMVWRYGGSPWHEKYFNIKKPLWAPEVHYLKNTYWLTYSLPGWDGTGKTSGCGLLRSTTGKPEGPYEDVQSAERMGDEIDASLFQDDDGQVYFLWHSGKIARMKPDMSGLAEPYRWLKTTHSDADPKHHSSLCAGIFGPASFDHVGYEGMSLFKHNDRYYLVCAEQFDGRYSCAVATAAGLYGPYGERYEAIPHAGHNTFFKDDRGQWWSTYFGSDSEAPWRERPGILPVSFDAQGRVMQKD